mgnify:CR=1 FL=1
MLINNRKVWSYDEKERHIIFFGCFLHARYIVCMHALHKLFIFIKMSALNRCNQHRIVFPMYVKEGVFVLNHAKNGRSTKSFLDEGRLEAEDSHGRTPIDSRRLKQ